MNPRIPVLQTSALPLCYLAISLNGMEIVASLLRLSTWGWVFFKTKGCAGTSSRCCGGEGLSPCLCRLPFTRPLTRCFSDGTVLRVGACGGFYEPGGLEATPGLQRMRSRWMLRTAPDHAGTLHTRSRLNNEKKRTVASSLFLGGMLRGSAPYSARLSSLPSSSDVTPSAVTSILMKQLMSA